MPSLSSRFPALSTRPRHVELLPDARFFVRAVPLSSDAEAGSVRDQLELALEAVAPFPIGQLYWGHWTRPGCGRALIFAAYRKRFAPEETENWGEADWVAPRFGAVLAGKAPEPATTVLVRSAEGLTALHFDDDSGVPVTVRAVELPEEAEEREFAAAREQLIKSSGGSRKVVDLTGVEVEAGQPGDDEIVIVRDGERIELTLDDAQTLDVRDQGELSARRRARVRDAWMWRAVVAAVAVLLLSGLTELTLLGLAAWQKTQLRQIAAQTPVVSEIETAHRLASRIEELRTRRLKPFEMIALVDGPRPESIVFRRTTATGLYSLEIEAETDSPPDIDVYINALKALPGTQDVRMLNLNTDRSRSTLRLLVNFTEDAFDVSAPEPLAGLSPKAGEVSS